jgi:hypothetical protein
VVLDVEQPCGLVGALDIATELIEIPALVAEEGSLGDARMGLAGLLDGGEECSEPAGHQVGLAQPG